MLTWQGIVAIAAGISTLCGTITYFAKVLKKIQDDNKKSKEDLECIQEGVKCMLRSSMLNTYYKNNDAHRMHQYEAENFGKQYAAYKAAHGNSFIDHIHDEVKTWDIDR